MIHPSTLALFDELDEQIDGAKSALSILRAATHEPKHRADPIDEAPLRPLYPAPRHRAVGPSPDESVAAFDTLPGVRGIRSLTDVTSAPNGDRA